MDDAVPKLLRDVLIVEVGELTCGRATRVPARANAIIPTPAAMQDSSATSVEAEERVLDDLASVMARGGLEDFSASSLAYSALLV